MRVKSKLCRIDLHHKSNWIVCIFHLIKWTVLNIKVNSVSRDSSLMGAFNAKQIAQKGKWVCTIERGRRSPPLEMGLRQFYAVLTLQQEKRCYLNTLSSPCQRAADILHYLSHSPTPPSAKIYIVIYHTFSFEKHLNLMLGKYKLN